MRCLAMIGAALILASGCEKSGPGSTGPSTVPDQPGATRLLITADAGGSNGYRTRAWKAELAALAAGTGLDITVCHFPPGTQCRCLSY